MKIGKVIKEYRDKNGMTMQEFANASELSKAYISMLEKGKHPQNGKEISPSADTIRKVASAMGIPAKTLLDEDEEEEKEPPNRLKSYHEPKAMPDTKYVRVPVLGRVAAGIPIEQIEDVEDYEDFKVPANWDKEFFALKISGDSMQPKIWDGSIVIAERQEDAETGDIVIASINGDDAVCKQLKHFPGGIMLVSLNPAYEPMIFEEGDVDALPVRILGKVVEVRTTL